MKLILKNILFLILSLILNTSYSQKDEFDIYATFKADSVKKDIGVLSEIIMNAYPGFNFNASKEQVKHVTDSILQTINNDVSARDFYKKVAYIIAQLHDGHAFIGWEETYYPLKNNNTLLPPIRVARKKDKFYIDNIIHPKSEELIGKEIVAINGLEMEKIEAELFKYSSIEGTNTSHENYTLQRLPYLYNMLIDTNQTYTISYIKKNKIKTTKLPGVLITTLYLMTPKEPPVDFRVYDGIAVLDINSFIYDDYQHYFDSVFTLIDTSNIKKLIIDVRGNEGGAPAVSNYLFSYLSPKPYYYFDYIGFSYNQLGDWTNYLNGDFQPVFDSTKRRSENGLYCYTEKDDENCENDLCIQQNKKNYYKGKLLTLIDGGSFSTTGHFVALLKAHHIGRLIGETTYGSYFSNDGATYFTLPTTKLSVRIPVVQYTMRLPDFKYDPKGIKPDKIFDDLPKVMRYGDCHNLNELTLFDW